MGHPGQLLPRVVPYGQPPPQGFVPIGVTTEGLLFVPHRPAWRPRSNAAGRFERKPNGMYMGTGAANG